MIIQIIPCSTELYARFKQGDGEFTTRIVCMALVEETEGGITYRSVVGMDACDDVISAVEGNVNFLGYTDEPLAARLKPSNPTSATSAKPA